MDNIFISKSDLVILKQLIDTRSVDLNGARDL